jgi:hypothetical protein
MKERKLTATRNRVDELLAEGWSISGREPLSLSRAHGTATVMPSGIISYGRR